MRFERFLGDPQADPFRFDRIDQLDAQVDHVPAWEKDTQGAAQPHVEPVQLITACLQPHVLDDADLGTVAINHATAFVDDHRSRGFPWLVRGGRDFRPRGWRKWPEVAGEGKPVSRWWDPTRRW